LQATIIGPVFKNHTFLSKYVYTGARKITGISFEFNGAALEQTKPTWFVANHISRADFMIGSFLPNSSFVMNARFFDWPVIGQVAKLVRIIGTEQSQEKKLQDRGRIIHAFNSGTNITMFPEGTTTDGREVLRFSAGLMPILFGEHGTNKTGDDIKLEKEAVMQPLAMRVKSVNGIDVLNDKDRWDAYTMAYNDDNLLKRIWQRCSVPSIVVEITALPPMNPADYSCAEDFANAAHDKIRDIVCPDQTEARSRRVFLEDWEAQMAKIKSGAEEVRAQPQQKRDYE